MKLFVIYTTALLLIGCATPQVNRPLSNESVIALFSEPRYDLSYSDKTQCISLLYSVFEELQSIKFRDWESYRLYINSRFQRVRDFGEYTKAHQFTAEYYMTVGALGEALKYTPAILSYIVPQQLERIKALHGNPAVLDPAI